MALKTKRERTLVTLVGVAALIAATFVSARWTVDLLRNMDDEIESQRDTLEKMQTTFNNLEGIEDEFGNVVRELRIPGELDQQKDRVLRDLVDLIGAAGIQDNYRSVQMDENVNEIEDEFFVVRITVNDIRCERTALAKFLFLIDRMSTMEVDSLELRSSNRSADDTVRSTVRVTRLIPTKEFMKGIEEEA